MYFISYPLLPITLSTVILNLPINWFYPPHTVLVLIPDNNSLSLFPPSLPSCCSFSWWFLLKTVARHHLYYVFTNVRLLLIEKDFSKCRMSRHFPRDLLCEYFIQRPLHFLLRVIHIYLYFVYIKRERERNNLRNRCQCNKMMELAQDRDHWRVLVS